MLQAPGQRQQAVAAKAEEQVQRQHHDGGDDDHHDDHDGVVDDLLLAGPHDLLHLAHEHERLPLVRLHDYRPGQLREGAVRVRLRFPLGAHKHGAVDRGEHGSPAHPGLRAGEPAEYKEAPPAQALQDAALSLIHI